MWIDTILHTFMQLFHTSSDQNRLCFSSTVCSQPYRCLRAYSSLLSCITSNYFFWLQDPCICPQAVRELIVERDIAGKIKAELDSLYGPLWHCIVGKSYGEPYVVWWLAMSCFGYIVDHYLFIYTIGRDMRECVCCYDSTKRCTVRNILIWGRHMHM